MALGSPPPSSECNPERRISRRVSTMIPSPADEVVDDLGNEAPDESRPSVRKRSRPSSALLTRQVSHEAFSIAEVEKENKEEPAAGGRGSPVRCVSEFDEVTSAISCLNQDGASRVNSSNAPKIPPLPNPLHNPNMLAYHVNALKLEAELQPMRLILSRLVAHPTYNRKGIFNVPVNAVTLGLSDYFTVITKPMDLGTIKARLHAVAYESHSAVAEDIRLVFQNAMTYNPPNNGVHVSARELLAFFEDQYQAFVPGAFLSNKPCAAKCPPAATPSSAASTAPPTQAGSQAIASVGSPSITTVSDENILCTAPSETEAIRSTSASAVASTGNAAGIQSSETEAIHPTPASAVASPSNTIGIQSMPPPPVHTQATRMRTPAELLSNNASLSSRKRKKRGTCSNASHSCQWCEGRTCALCKQGCLHLEPTLLICNGPHCHGAKIRKGAVYYIARDGSRQFCHRCHTGLPAVLLNGGQDDACRYKRNLLKRKNDEEVVERWLSCSKCKSTVHQVCAMHNEHAHLEDEYVCPGCISTASTLSFPANGDFDSDERDCTELYTFVTGQDLPLKISEVAGKAFRLGEDVLSSDALPETDVSSFIQRKVRERMISTEFPNAEQTVVVRIISDCNRYFKVPEVVRKHFRMAANEAEASAGQGSAMPPTKVNYRSKAIALFQKVDGFDVCIFCMYVQEYGGDDEYEPDIASDAVPQKKRVYIAYLDSVEHFRPRPCRSAVYHEMLVSYLATARKKGFEIAHIWACPPSRGNSFVFWNHPASQRTPTQERLVAWYHGALSRAVDCGIVTDVKSLYQTDFERCINALGKKRELHEDTAFVDPGRFLCPPLLDGDFWIEEAVRVHNVNIARNVKANVIDGEVCSSQSTFSSVDELHEGCPARHVAAILRDRVIAHPSSTPFRRPVNAAALKLKDYHRVISKPMDLGTVYSQCVLGEYRTLNCLVADVDLVFSNAMRYNPSGHYVHTKAIEMKALFFSELNHLASSWDIGTTKNAPEPSWHAFANVNMSLDASFGSMRQGVEKCDHEEAIVANPPSVDAKPLSRPSDHALRLLTGGPEAVLNCMIGNDTWILDKRNPLPPKSAGFSKKTGGRKKKNSGDSVDDPPTKRRRQSWLGEEVGTAVRRMRTCFFTCSLVPKAKMSNAEQEKVDTFASYTDIFEISGAPPTMSSRIADARHALIEFSQFRNLEFDTLRRAKYSTATLLYHLHHNDAPGMVPTCSSCHNEIKDVRWHKVNKLVERRRDRLPPSSRKQTMPLSSGAEELCSDCHSNHPLGDEFIPLQVSFRP
jgi:hypothetical protein